MKRIFSCMVLVAAVLFISCKKDVPGSISVKLSATSFYKDGSEETRYERSGTIERSSYAQLINDGTSNKYLVNLGASGNAPDLSSFGVSFVFNKQTSPEGVTGSYNFPQDQLLIRVALRNEVTQTVTENILFPTRGKASFAYEMNNRTISGSIDDLEFSIVPNDPYNRYRVTVKGTFRNVPVR